MQEPKYKVRFDDKPEIIEPLLFISPNETRDREGVVPLTESGAVRRVPFDGGQAFYIEEGTTNLIPNPTFVGMSRWVSSGGPSQDQAVLHEGSPTASITRGTQWYLATSPLAGIEVGDTITGTVWVLQNEGRLLRVRFHDGSQYFDDANWSSSADGEWTRISLTVTVPSNANLQGIRLYVYANTSPIDEPIWIGSPQVEKKPYATSFTHGDMGDGYSWTGTPHDSPSVREPSYAYATHPMPNEQGSMYIRYKFDYLTGATSGDHGQAIGGFGSIGGGSTRALLAQVRSGNQLHLRQVGLRDSGRRVSEPFEVSGLYLEYTSENVVADWMDGGPKQVLARVNYSAENESAFHNDSIPVGYSGHASIYQHLNGYVAVIIAYDTPLTEAEIARLDAIPTRQLTWRNVHVSRPINGVRMTWKIEMPEGVGPPTKSEYLHNGDIYPNIDDPSNFYGKFRLGSRIHPELELEGTRIIEGAALDDLLGVRVSSDEVDYRWSTNQAKPPFLQASPKKIFSRFDEEVEISVSKMVPTIRNGILTWRVSSG